MSLCSRQPPDQAKLGPQVFTLRAILTGLPAPTFKAAVRAVWRPRGAAFSSGKVAGHRRGLVSQAGPGLAVCRGCVDPNTHALEVRSANSQPGKRETDF